MRKHLPTPISLAFFYLAAALPLPAQNLVITNARILDGNGGVLERGTVAVRDGRIVSVGAAAANIPGARRIDARGLTVMPGFIDAHRHIIQGDPAQWMKEQAVPRMQEFLDAGFTSVLSCADPTEQILDLRGRLDKGAIKGPRLLAAGVVPLARGGALTPGVDPARTDNSRPPNRPTAPAQGFPREETLKIVQSLAKAGVDAFKTIITVTPGGPEKDTLRLIAEEARKLGIPSITHAVSVEDTLAAVEARTDILVHTPHIGQLTLEQARKIADARIPMMSTLGVFVPTFAQDNQRIRERTGIDNMPRFRDLDPFPMDTLSSAGQGPVNARLVWDAGITYAYGTDTTFLPKDSLVHELKPLRLMFTNRDILTMLTRNAAIAMGRGKDRGTLEAGKLADIVILEGDPLADIQNLLRVKTVIKGGEVVVDRR
jgi:imidazolonepropionase-like amidohydrolase